MTVQNTSAPRAAPAPTQTNTTAAATTDTGPFKDAAELQSFITDGELAMQIKGTLAGSSELADSSWVKGFEKGVQERVAALGANPSKEDVKKAMNAEFFEQRVGKMAVDRASARIMDRVKEMYSDTFK